MALATVLLCFSTFRLFDVIPALRDLHEDLRHLTVRLIAAAQTLSNLDGYYMHVCMYIRMYMCICVCTQVYVYMRGCVYVCTMHVYAHVHVQVGMDVDADANIDVDVDVYVSVNIYVNVYVNVYVLLCATRQNVEDPCLGTPKHSLHTIGRVCCGKVQ